MLSADDNKPIGKPGQRARKKKAKQQTTGVEQHATAAAQSPDTAVEISQEVDQEANQETHQETSEDISVQVPLTETLPAEVASAPVAAMELVPVSIQTIAEAYGDYTRTSLERAWNFLGRLASARSPAEAFELQMEFAKQAYESFVAESEKIVELHGQLARQKVVHFEGFVARITQTTFELRATRH
jgi:phasin family protein